MKPIVVIKTGIGFVSLAFGIVGLLLPVWPTTPFVLLAIGCFSSTPKLRAKILNVEIFKEYYEGYTTGSGLQRQTVIHSLAFLWISIGLSCIFAKQWPVVVLLIVVAVAVTVHIQMIAKGKQPGHSNKEEIQP